MLIQNLIAALSRASSIGKYYLKETFFIHLVCMHSRKTHRPFLLPILHLLHTQALKDMIKTRDKFHSLREHGEQYTMTVN